ncbi:hypothetical protein LDO26_12455 [Luteimonas sp. BDR2-5]|uniref:hypothetical protein n=1 Tax=Proluteimonas luteida TaxID=2878685 RepID=UPI001E4B11E2|nr:hypothetical protein [Luteimonas sp. BDR2-5]MCD9029011.1 hypothetical protein [Luteimonas sp. BDR2-5]
MDMESSGKQFVAGAAVARVVPVLPLALAASMLSFPCSVNAGGFVMPGTSYSADFPGEPACEIRIVSPELRELDQRACAWFDEDLGGGYVLEVFPLPVDVDIVQPAVLLRAMVHGGAAASRSEVMREVDIEVDGLPALEAELLDRERGVLAKVVYVLGRGEVISISVDGGWRIHEADAAAVFLKSLRVAPAQLRSE